jgi:drug/metabolite transporter (DMT)-like permease
MKSPSIGSPSRALAILAIVATTALWGASYPLIKQLIDTVPPSTLAVLRLLIALAVMTPVLLLAGKRPRIGWPSALLGVTGVAAFQLLHNFGIERMPAATALVLVFGASVILTTALGWVTLGESFSMPVLLSLLGSAAGVALVASGAGGAGGGVSLGALVLVLLSALAWSVYAVLGRRFIAGDPSELNAGAMLVGLIVMAPFMAYERPDSHDMALSGGDLLALFVLGALVTSGSYLLWGHGIRHLRANEASVLCSIEPAFGLFFAWSLLRESISLQEAVGAVVIVASCALVALGDSKPEPAPVVALAEAV